MSRRPAIVGIPCDHRIFGVHPFHMVGEKYITALHEGAELLPVLIPVLRDPISIDDILASVDGLFFTGSPSNVAPKNYGGTPPREGIMQDELRDMTTLPLMRAALASGMPMLCVCRGFQELNVALGGSLHQHIHEVEGRRDHREDKTATLDIQYGPAHSVTVNGGQLGQITPSKEFEVNSLHSQGIDRLAEGLHADAVAPDGQIEAVSVVERKSFALGVQWHPEWRWSENPVSRDIYRAFGDAVRSNRSAHD